MLSHSQFLRKCDTSELEKEIIVDGKIIIKPHSFYTELDPNVLKMFLHVHGIYVLPTEELINWLKENISGSAIEIGAGNGAISRALKIPITDSRLQEQEEIKKIYSAMGQPVIIYPDDVEKLDADEAIKKYNPDTVIGAFITHKYRDDRPEIGGNQYGVEEESILDAVKKYINIGNLITHGMKPILKIKHEQYFFDWIITRAVDQKMNRIFVW